MSEQQSINVKVKKVKKEKKETLLLKYGLISLIVIVCSIASFLVVSISMTRKPIASIFNEAIENIVQQSVDSVEDWFGNQIELLRIYRNGVIDDEDTWDSVKDYIKDKTVPESYDYVMVFNDESTGAADGGPETYNSKGGVSKGGILTKEYWIQHKNNNVDVWLESPRQSNTGVFSMPVFVSYSYDDEDSGDEVTGGMVGFLELSAIEKLGKSFYKTGNVSVYDDTGSVRAGEEVFADDGSEDSSLVYFRGTCELANKEWTIVATITKAEINEVTNVLRRNSIIGGLIAAAVIIFSILLIIKNIIHKFDSIRQNIDNLNSGDKDLTKRLKINHNNEISSVKKSVNQFVDTVHTTVREIDAANRDLSDCYSNVEEKLTDTLERINLISDKIKNASGALASQDNSVNSTSSAVTEISENIRSLNNMIESQSAAITQSSASIEQMIGNIKSVSNSVEQMSAEFEDLSKATEDGIKKNNIVNDLLQTILSQSNSLQDANRVISEISSQTNLLSMNAMIESAHAGEAGKGFAVVAEEIRKLADTSATQSKSIGENLKDIAGNIAKVVESANASTQSFETVFQKTQNTSQLVETITSAMEEQNEGSKQILQALSTMNDSSLQVKTASEEMQIGTGEILKSATELKDSANQIEDSFGQIASTVDATVENTNTLQNIVLDMASAVKNISDKINEFKI